jgi:hypothetical protein
MSESTKQADVDMRKIDIDTNEQLDWAVGEGDGFESFTGLLLSQ